MNESMTIIDALYRTHLQTVMTQKGDKWYKPIAVGSGFFVQYKNRTFFVTADHTVHLNDYSPQGNSRTGIEYQVNIVNNINTKDRHSVMTPVGGFTYLDAFNLYNPDNVGLVDVAACELKTVDIQYPFYTPSMREPDGTIHQQESIVSFVPEAFSTPKEGTECCVFGQVESEVVGDEMRRTNIIHNLTFSYKSEDVICLDNGTVIDDVKQWAGLSGTPVLDSNGGLVGVLTSVGVGTNKVYGISWTRIKMLLDTIIATDHLSKVPIADVLNMENTVEPETTEVDADIITKPYDPNKIDVDIATINLGLLIEWLSYDMIDLSPSFQRSSDLWSKEQKSRLIESILLKLPLPSFYLNELPEGDKYAIIDGLQRCCALKDFIIEKKEPLRLCGLQFLDKYEGKTYDELSFQEQLRIKSLKITVNTLKKYTPNDVKYVIFQRVNTSGIPLEPQEMRNALNQGKPVEFIQKLAKLEEFKRATCYSIKPLRMLDCDFVNRFVAFYLALDEYDGDLDQFLNTQMGRIKMMTTQQLQALETDFKETMKYSYQIFGADTFRRRYNESDARKPISKSVFDTISINIAKLSPSQRTVLVDRKEEVKSSLIELFQTSSFDVATRVGTGKKKAVEVRFDMVKKMFNEILKR